MMTAPRQVESKGTWGPTWEVESHTSDEVYRVAQKPDGSWGCSCKGWIFKKAPKPDCKHILQIKKVEPVDTKRTQEFLATLAKAAELAYPTVNQPPKSAVIAPVFLLQTHRRIHLED